MGKPQVIALVALTVCAVGFNLGGCSLALDFSEGVDAAPVIDLACEAFEPNDGEAMPAAVTVGERQDAALCGGRDIDLFSFNLADGQDLAIVADGSVGFNFRLELLSDGLTIESSDSIDQSESIRRTVAAGNPLAAGTYLIRVAASSQSIGGKEGDYSLLVTID